MSFYLKWSSHHRDLHSFPTRRSSDLAVAEEAAELKRQAEEGLARRLQVHGLSPGTTEDRKSTRLNSSHGYISYAVFCLKKKMLNIQHILGHYIDHQIEFVTNRTKYRL